MQIIIVIFVASFLWGATNPFLGKASSGIEKIHSDSQIKKIFLELYFLFTNLNYLIPFVLNQLGSVLFYVALAYANLSLVVPLTNSLTLLFTTITSILLGEQTCNFKTFVGLFFVIAGVSICVSSSN